MSPALFKVFAGVVMAATVLIIVIGHLFVPSVAADVAAKTSFVPGLVRYRVCFIAFLGVLWFAVKNKRFKGRPVGDEIKRRRSSIASQESALAAGQ